MTALLSLQPRLAGTEVVEPVAEFDQAQDGLRYQSGVPHRVCCSDGMTHNPGPGPSYF